MCNLHLHSCACHLPCWSTDRLLLHLDGCFRPNAGICSVTVNMFQSFVLLLYWTCSLVDRNECVGLFGFVCCVKYDIESCCTEGCCIVISLLCGLVSKSNRSIYTICVLLRRPPEDKISLRRDFAKKKVHVVERWLIGQSIGITVTIAIQMNVTMVVPIKLA